jgi:hypothetical protein
MHAGLEPVADAEPYTRPEAEPVAEPYVDPGVEPDPAVYMTGITAVSVCGLLASPVEGWGAVMALMVGLPYCPRAVQHGRSDHVSLTRGKVRMSDAHEPVVDC